MIFGFSFKTLFQWVLYEGRVRDVYQDGIPEWNVRAGKEHRVHRSFLGPEEVEAGSVPPSLGRHQLRAAGDEHPVKISTLEISVVEV